MRPSLKNGMRAHALVGSTDLLTKVLYGEREEEGEAASNNKAVPKREAAEEKGKHAVVKAERAQPRPRWHCPERHYHTDCPF